MNNAEIQIRFLLPGEWNKFTLTAVYLDAEGYIHTDRYTQDDIPADQAPAMSAVVSALVGMGEDWQASQVWARLDDFINFDRRTDEPTSVESIWLTVEAVNPQGGRRTFTATD
jgi:hypothetical protein